MCLWLAIGVIFGTQEEGWSFVQSLYFSVAALSTAGLQAPSTGDFPMLFVAFYSLSGVPIFAAALGAMANWLVDRHVERQQARQVNQLLTPLEFEQVMNLQHTQTLGGEEMVNFAEFLQVHLLRLGACDVPLLKIIHKQFDQLDINGDGQISHDELHQRWQKARLALTTEVVESTN